MRFHQLAIGTRFQFEGGFYTKTSPVMANDESGKAVFMKRSDAVEPADVSAQVSDDINQPHQILAMALARYTNEAMEIVHNAFHPAEAATLNKVHQKLSELEQHLLEDASSRLD
ncbi:MAG: hypothetical protein HUJ29_11970 [Gammaproteobacteria bacterium]|nr:hypothetical protein [Gammaproteobacteria bacterium]